jgi:hypothetical protein
MMISIAIEDAVLFVIDAISLTDPAGVNLTLLAKRFVKIRCTKVVTWLIGLSHAGQLDTLVLALF